jgi:CSLREA domain-containing protein
MMKRHANFLRLASLALAAVGLQIPSSEVSAQGADAAIASLTGLLTFGFLYFVDSTGDGDNVASGDLCDDGTGHCTLRAAIEATNQHSGDDGIEIGIPTSDPGYNGTFWTINLTRALPDLSQGVSISGPGASALVV